jgi:hypothetical protein
MTVVISRLKAQCGIGRQVCPKSDVLLKKLCGFFQLGASPFTSSLRLETGGFENQWAHHDFRAVPGIGIGIPRAIFCGRVLRCEQSVTNQSASDTP